MMSKIGRNDPCPCGSGKKYKKCCLPKVQQRSITDRRKNETNDFFEDLPAEPAGLRDENEAMEASARSGPELEDEPFVSHTISDEVPEIGEKENAFVDAWWTAYHGMKDPDEIVRHLDTFFEAHPGLVTNLELHHEVLFALGDQLVKAGRASDYIELLQRVRRDFPDAYLKGFGYFDRDIIHYKIASRDPEGIENYLDWFEEYPDNDADLLFSLIDFLMATECDQPLIVLLEATYYSVCRSEKVIGGGKILVPLILSYCATYLDRGWTRADLDALSEQLKAIRIPLKDQLYRPEYLDTLFEEILGDLDAAFFDTFYEIWDIQEYYRTVSHNFMGWLRKEKQFSWMKAQFYRNQVNSYLMHVIPDGKRPKRPFVFSRKLLEDTISRMARKIFSLDATKTLGALSAIYWFAEYLLQYQAISEQECADVQGWCEEWWRIAIPHFLDSTIEAHAFDTFPR
jgi:tetratricopeptide (TPR) repeat protein